MATDPYHAVQQEVQASLQTAGQLRSSYLRIRNLAVREDNEELIWARNELKASLSGLEADLEDLEESVKMVESTDARLFGLDDSEVQRRRQYVRHVRKEIETMRAEVTATSPPPAQTISRGPLSAAGSAVHLASTPRARSPQPPFSNGVPVDDQSAWSRQEQEMMIREQDRTMDSISGTLTTLAQQAGLMGQEINEHNEMLSDLEANVDITETRLSRSMKQLKEFARKSEEKGSGWCIGVLILILGILLLVAILV